MNKKLVVTTNFLFLCKENAILIVKELILFYNYYR